MSQQIGGPARYQKPEESGMSHAEPTARTMTALLRNAASVDAQEAKSRCCAAAGITALAHSTTEARTPHEKLRGAATPGAMLNAQGGLLAQHVLGNKAFLFLFRLLQLCQFLRRNVDGLRVSRKNICTSHHIFCVPLSKQPREYDALLERPSNNKKWLHHFLARKIYRINSFESHQLLFNGSHYLCFKCNVFRLHLSETLKQKATDSCCTTRHTEDKLNYNVLFSITNCDRILGLLIADVKCRANCCNATKSLKPCCSLLFQSKRIKHSKQCPSQGPYRNNAPNNPNTGEPHSRRHAEILHVLWLQAIKKNGACPFLDLPSTKEAA